MTKQTRHAKAFDKFARETLAKKRLDRQIVCPSCELELRIAAINGELNAFDPFTSHVSDCLASQDQPREMTEQQQLYFGKMDSLLGAIKTRAQRH